VKHYELLSVTNNLLILKILFSLQVFTKLQTCPIYKNPSLRHFFHLSSQQELASEVLSSIYLLFINFSSSIFSFTASIINGVPACFDYNKLLVLRFTKVMVDELFTSMGSKYFPSKKNKIEIHDQD
jgi:hypothetical protein